jgi:hypothetical protein
LSGQDPSPRQIETGNLPFQKGAALIPARFSCLSSTVFFFGDGGGGGERGLGDMRPAFIANEIQDWLKQASVGTLYIQKASPRENG